MVKYSLNELRDLAKDNNIVGYSGINKKKLIILLLCNNIKIFKDEYLDFNVLSKKEVKELCIGNEIEFKNNESKNKLINYLIKNNIRIKFKNYYNINIHNNNTRMTIINILNEFCIPDISNIIIGYTTTFADNFTKKFVNECIKEKNYIVCDKFNKSLIHYMFEKKIHKLYELLNGSTLSIKYFQNKNINNQTEFYLICKNNMCDVIKLFKDLTPEDFVNNSNNNSLSEICKNNILFIKYLNDNFVNKFNAKHFQNNNGITPLYELCNNKNIDLDFIKYLNNSFKNKFKLEHFQNNNKGETELYALCCKRQYRIIRYLNHSFKKGNKLKVKHFVNNEIYILCMYGNYGFIKYLNDNFEGIKFRAEHFTHNNNLYLLCCYKHTKTITYLSTSFEEGYKFKAEHFQVKHYSKTGLHELCRLTDFEFMKSLNESFEEGHKFKVEHFQNKDKYGCTELFYLCRSKKMNTIEIIKYLNNSFNIKFKADHFLNKNNNGYTELHELCENKMYDTILYINNNFTDKFTKKHFGNFNYTAYSEYDILYKNNMCELIKKLNI